MDSKIKILIGVLVVGVVLIAGWWIRNGQTIKNPRGICGPKGMGINYDVLYCDETCNVDDDCKFTCGCGAINKNEICHDEGITYDCVDHEVKCKEGRCIIGKEILLKQVTLTTDKTDYEEGEEMKIVINNKRDKPIYLLLEGDIYADPIKIEIERHENGSWVSALSPFTLFSKNQKCGPFGQGPRIGCEKIEPQEKLEIEKSLYYSKCVDGQPKRFSFPPGRYRLKIGIGEKCWAGTAKEAPNIIYSNEFTIKEKITCDWCGRACVRYPVSKEDCEKAGGIFFKQCACPEVAPPEDLICVEENGKCVQKSKVKGKPPIVGGPCSYDEFRGKCKITSIFNENKIRFKFIPTEPLNLENIGWVKSKEDITNREYEEYVGYLGLKCLDKYPITGEDLERCNIKENTVFDCEIGLITKGTCTPIVFKFCE